MRLRQVNVYSVPLGLLITLPRQASQHEEWLQAIRDDCWFAEEIDEMIADGFEVDEPRLTFLDVVGRLLRGEARDDVPDFAAGYAYEAICWAIGSTLCMVENHFGHTHEAIDAFLRDAGVPLRLEDLTETGPILDLPEVDEYPFLGWWTPEQIFRAAGPLRALPLDEIEPRMAGDLRKLLAWLEEAEDQPGDCIVGFGIS
jgi:hypothetical protein